MVAYLTIYFNGHLCLSSEVAENIHEIKKVGKCHLSKILFQMTRDIYPDKSKKDRS